MKDAVRLGEVRELIERAAGQIREGAYPQAIVTSREALGIIGEAARVPTRRDVLWQVEKIRVLANLAAAEWASGDPQRGTIALQQLAQHTRHSLVVDRSAEAFVGMCRHNRPSWTAPECDSKPPCT